MGVTPRNTTISLSEGSYCYNVRKIKVIWPLLRDEAVVLFSLHSLLKNLHFRSLIRNFHLSLT